MTCSQHIFCSCSYTRNVQETDTVPRYTHGEVIFVICLEVKRSWKYNCSDILLNNIQKSPTFLKVAFRWICKYVLHTFLRKITVVWKQQLRKHLIIVMWICLHQACNVMPSCWQIRSCKIHCYNLTIKNIWDYRLRRSGYCMNNDITVQNSFLVGY